MALTYARHRMHSALESVTAEDIRRYYDENRALFRGPDGFDLATQETIKRRLHAQIMDREYRSLIETLKAEATIEIVNP